MVSPLDVLGPGVVGCVLRKVDDTLTVKVELDTLYRVGVEKRGMENQPDTLMLGS